jgi:uncharacterized ferritin-like protein (DUF455 family)
MAETDLNRVTNLHAAARICLGACAPAEKLALTREIAQGWRHNEFDLEDGPPVEPVPDPGRPPFPRLVPPRNVPRRDLRTSEGRAALVHALAHIEFNAMNLAWDAVYRFRGMPIQFYDDWVCVADEEAHHFGLLRQRLNELCHDYGDFDAHNGLWEMACKTDHDVLLRMALVPRVLEARGLDVTPGMTQRLRNAGDERTVSILEIILRDEVGHVAIGSRWFKHACVQRGLDSERVFRELLLEHMKGRIKGPFHEIARCEAGFTENELAELKLQAGA